MSSEITTSLIRMTPNQFNAEMRPRLEAFITAQGDDLAAHEPFDREQALRDMYDLVHGQSSLDWTLSTPAMQQLPDVSAANISPACVIAITGVAVGTVALLFQAAGVPSSVSRAAGQTVIRQALSESPLLMNTLQNEVAAISRADGLIAQAKALFALGSSINKVVSIGSIVSAIKDQMSWYQWVITGVVAVAQLTVWFATDGVAAVAELVLFGTAIASLVISAQGAVTTCSAQGDMGEAVTSAGVASPVQPAAFVSLDTTSLYTYGMDVAGNLWNLPAKNPSAWTQVNASVEDFSCSLDSARFPAGSIWLIAPNGDADGPISYVDFNTGNRNSVPGAASLISSADDGDTWVLNAAGGLYQWDWTARNWNFVPIPQSTLSQVVSSSANLQYGLMLLTGGTKDTTVVLNHQPGKDWEVIAQPPEESNITVIATNAAGDLACVTDDNRAFLYSNQGSEWVQLGGDDLLVQNICIRDPKNTWVLDTAGVAVALGPLINPGDTARATPAPGQLGWDTESVWDETKSTHLFIVNRAMALLGSSTDPRVQAFVTNMLQPFAIQSQSGAFRTNLCQGLYDADFLSAYNNPNWIGQATWKSHFYDAASGLNYEGESDPTALSNGVKFLGLSGAAYSANDPAGAGYQLGLALHYFTDLTQPMHSANYTYLSSVPFGYHTDFEVYTLSVQATIPQPTVTGFVPGSVSDFPTLYKNTAQTFKQTYFAQIDQAHKYLSWKWSPGQWQNAVLPMLPKILNDAVQGTAQLLYAYFKSLPAT